MQARLEQPVVWLSTAGKTASALSALEPRVGSSARHPLVSNKCPIRGRECPRTSIYKYGAISQQFQALLKHVWTPKDTSASLSRRKQGFESPRERQRFQNTHSAS